MIVLFPDYCLSFYCMFVWLLMPVTLLFSSSISGPDVSTIEAQHLHTGYPETPNATDNNKCS